MKYGMRKRASQYVTRPKQGNLSNIEKDRSGLENDVRSAMYVKTDLSMKMLRSTLPSDYLR